MGLETTTTATLGRKSASGKLHLDSRELTFTSAALKWSATLGPGLRATCTATKLTVVSSGKSIVFEVGVSAPKWVKKILNPPTLVKKLGVKGGHSMLAL